MKNNRWRFAWAWLIGAVLVGGLVSLGCNGINPPGPPQPPKTCPDSCPLGSECKDAAQGCQPIPAPGPVCEQGQNYSCWHWPPDSRTWLYACPVYDANGGVVGVINVVGGAAQCPAKPGEPPVPTCPASCPAGQACADPAKGCVPTTTPPPTASTNCDGEPGGITGQTTSAFGSAVNEEMAKESGCSIGSDCRLTMTNQQWFRKIIERLRARGICAGQHEPNVTDEIAVSQDRGSIREGYHIFSGDDSGSVPPPAGAVRKVVWSPGAARPSYYGSAEAPPPVIPPPTGSTCPYAPCPARVWTAETLPPGWGSDQIGKPAYQYNAHPHTMGNIDSTPVVIRQEPFCASIGLSPMADGTPRASCPVRPDMHPERVAVENWLLFGGPTRDSRNGQDCTPNNTTNPAAFLGGTNNCRMCNVPKTVCTDWF